MDQLVSISPVYPIEIIENIENIEKCLFEWMFAKIKEKLKGNWKIRKNTSLTIKKWIKVIE